jgi:NAD(P)-dependent dehydrogenase (short-subunit alcohol dehydrogenase family)
MTAAQPLKGHIAVVAGATRGAGRGIARGLGEAGATVYCTGRSVRGNPSPYNRPETIEETAELVTAAGGVGIALRVDHGVESEVEALFARIARDHSRLDVLVSSIGGENPLFGAWAYFWQTDFQHGAEALQQSLLSHLITAKHAAPLMIKKRRGLIVEVTEGDTVFGGGGNALTDVVKSAQKGFTNRMAEEVRKYRVTAVAITPGFLRSEGMLEHFGVTEANWRDAGKKDKNFLESESPLFIGRCVAALAADPNVFERSGDILSSWELGRHYGLTDYDGRRPDWAAHGAKIFESTPFADAFRRHVLFLQRMTARASQYVGADNPAAEPRKTSGKRRAAR